MLKFWKKAERKAILLGSRSSSPTSTPKSQTSPVSNGGFHIGSVSIAEIETLIKQDKCSDKKSRLSKTLLDVISDNEALAYFIQYLETIGSGALIKLILDVESLNCALRNASQNDTEKHDSSDTYNLQKALGEFLLEISNTCKGENLSCDVAKNTVDVLSEDNQSDSGCENNKSANSSCTVLSDTKAQSENQQKIKIDDCYINEDDKALSRLLNSFEFSENTIDAIKIFQKYFSHNSPLKISIEPDVKLRLIENLKNGVNVTSFSEVKDIILKILEKEHFNDFLRSEYHCKYQIDVLTSNKVLISDILYNDTALFYLMEFLEQEGSMTFLEFWIAALNFQQQYENKGEGYDPIQAQDDAMVLYDKYFSLQATQPLHLGDNVRIQVEESICREEGPLPSCFDYPQKIIVKILETKFLEPFLQSQLYFKYLSELITTIQASPVLCSRSRNSGGSDCSSEVSISATNTLLVSEDINPPKRIFRHLTNSSMSIDTQQLYDPDSLWRRGPKRTGLNFGRINELGRFVTDLEPEPDKKGESRITKAVKKFVNLEEDKSKEEMAWQVAAMIVKDVTNVTMPSSTSS